MLYMATFTINIPQMLAYIPYVDPMGDDEYEYETSYLDLRVAIKDVWLLHMANKN